MAKKKKDPHQILNNLIERILDELNKEIWYIIERVALEQGEELNVYDHLPSKDLPLYSSGSNGEINKILATARLAGETRLAFSEQVTESVCAIINVMVDSGSSVPQTLEYSQGLISMACKFLEAIEDPRADIVRTWAAIDTQ